MADIAKGTLIKWGNTTVTEIVSFTAPAISADAVDATNLTSTAKPFLHPGLYDPGEVALELNFDPDVTIHDQIITDLAAGTKRVLSIEWLNATAANDTWTVNAYANTFSPGGTQGDKLTSSLTFKLTDAITP